MLLTCAQIRCNPLFVRCIKPNNSKMANQFEMKTVLEQLKQIGMLETIKIRKLGFPIRYKFSVFVSKYRVLIGKKPTFLEVQRDITQFILSKLTAKYKPMYQIGLSKVFLKEQLDNYLQQQVHVISERSALIIQKNLRMLVARRSYLKLRSNVIKLQQYARGWLHR